MDTGWIDPNSAYQQVGMAVTPWGNTRNALADDDQYASVGIDKNAWTYHLRLVNYRLTADEIPDGSTIDGIIARVRRYAASGDAIEDLSVYLWREGEEIGDNKASAEFFPTSEEAKDYGAEDDLWGTSDLTDAQVRDCDFGISFRAANNTGGYVIAYVDVIQLKIFYTPPPAVDDPTAINLSHHLDLP